MAKAKWPFTLTIAAASSPFFSWSDAPAPTDTETPARKLVHCVLNAKSKPPEMLKPAPTTRPSLSFARTMAPADALTFAAAAAPRSSIGFALDLSPRMPIAIPGLVCAILFAFTLSWNEFIYALTFTSSSDQITASVGVTSELIRGDIYFWGSLMAGAVLGSVPIVILYVFFLDYYVSGLTAGAVK